MAGTRLCPPSAQPDVDVVQSPKAAHKMTMLQPMVKKRTTRKGR